MKVALTALLVSAALLLTGCTQMRNEDAGVILGGALGGLVGSQFGSGTGQIAAAALGVLLGAHVGSNVGRSMDEVDRIHASRALESARTGHTSSWQNPDTGVEYTVTPTRTYESNGAPCRDFTTEAWIDGSKQLIRGTACRQPDGTWQTI